MGARGAQQVQSIAKVIFGQTSLVKEITALHRVRYYYQVHTVSGIC